jgi:2-C-methyl-D-erythritol 2,4-cyclodiphosphate synthase/2-C-methyl-D-erythritol 4-phosphate cytidylyltransferase
VRVVAGGERRQDSVANAFAAVGPLADLIVIHDAARPLVNADLIERTVAAAAETGAAIAAIPAHDTVKLAADAEDDTRMVERTLDRTRVWLAQTPQAFTRRILEDALAQAKNGATGTDEAALAERAGHSVRLVEGSPRNLKITTPEDLAQVERWLADTSDDAARSTPVQAAPIRVGIGYDSHRLVEGRPLLLGGVAIPHSRGLAGHSDADALCHAITDAILGAAALGDIGRHFPDTDPQWKDADSLVLLGRANELIRAKGFRVRGVDAVVVAERPKLSPHVDQIRASLAGALSIDLEAISVKGKTNEGMGEVGRGEAIVVHAVATLEDTGG